MESSYALLRMFTIVGKYFVKRKFCRTMINTGRDPSEDISLSSGWISTWLLAVTSSITFHVYYINTQQGVCYPKGDGLLCVNAWYNFGILVYQKFLLI